jgi:CDP-4-dehydro-6-deoxyglucose reductase
VSDQVAVSGSDVTFECKPGSTVLDAAEAAGWALPYSCRKGVCDSCAGRSSKARRRSAARP